MLHRTPWTIPIPLTALLLVGCHADDDERFRVYTTQTTLGNDGPACDPGETVTDVDPRRSLFETSLVALEPFSLEAVVEALAANGGVEPPLQGAPSLFRPFHVLCDGYVPPWGWEYVGQGSHVTGMPGVNGYPVLCERYEDVWGRPLAVVNRFDLAPSDGSSCGEVRVIFGDNSPNPVSWHPQDHVTIAIEAQIPNPAPECGIEACRPLQEFWAGLSDVDDAAERGEELRLAFLDGHPALEAAGFGPFMDWRHITFGTGQIRINGYNSVPRTLRQLEATPVATPWGTVLSATPVAVDGTTFGGLWNDPTLQHAAVCQDAIVASVQHLMIDDLNLMAIDVPPECLAGESSDIDLQDHPAALLEGGQGPGSLYQRIQDEILAVDPASTLTPVHLARRARMVSCVGCHEGNNQYTSLGNGMPLVSTETIFPYPTTRIPIDSLGTLAPDDLSGGQHVSPNVIDTCSGEPCYLVSPALEDLFLPFREQVMEEFLDSTSCCTDESGACCALETDPPECDPTVQLCDPSVECDPTTESCVGFDPDPFDGCDPTTENCGPVDPDPSDGCDPTTENCGPFPDPTIECDPTTENCGPFPDPTIECDPTTENCGPLPDPTGEGCFDPTGEGTCFDPTQEMGVDGRPQGFAAAPKASAPRPFEALDVEAFIALERRLRLRQSPVTISGRPNVGGH